MFTGAIDEGVYDEEIGESARRTINADALFVKENNKLALVVDHEFDDVPSWVEWDLRQQKLRVMEMGGDIVELNTLIEKKDAEDFRGFKSLYLVTNHGEQKIRHTVSLITRD